MYFWFPGSLWDADVDSETWLYCIYAISSMIPSGGLTVFFTLLIQGYGFDARTTLLLSMPGGSPKS